MPRAQRICPRPGCPHLITTGRYCPDHARAYERQRGTRQQRGYDLTHERLRARWAARVATGAVPCARCGSLIEPSAEWALDHTDDRTGYLGPSHATCNNRAGGVAAHR